jgi:hypothetical protein
VSDDDIVYRYCGAGHEFLMSVPARDLTALDLTALSPSALAELEQVAQREGGLYQHVLGEEADPSVPGEIDADEINPAVTPDPDPPVEAGDPAVAVEPVAVVGEPIVNPGGVVQSDHL